MRSMPEYDWIDIGGGRKVYRKVGPVSRGPRSDLSCPNLIKPFAEAVQSMATGEWFTSKEGLSNSYKASGNPQGVDYVELGNEKPQGVEYTPDPTQRRDDIKRAMNDVLTGNLPPEIAAIE